MSAPAVRLSPSTVHVKSAKDAVPVIAPLAGALRNVGLGWELLDNTGHRPINLDHVVDIGPYLRVFYDTAYLRVGALTVCPDETFAALGYHAGASAGLAYANVFMYDASGVAIAPADLVSSTGNWWLSGHMWLSL